MGQDKALLDIGGVTAIERIANTCHAAGVDEVLVVRRSGAAPLGGAQPWGRPASSSQPLD